MKHLKTTSSVGFFSLAAGAFAQPVSATVAQTGSNAAPIQNATPGTAQSGGSRDEVGLKQPPEGSREDQNTVVVTGTRPTIESSIDRRSYRLSKDVQAATGSVADSLRSIPSVSVDVQGNVSLRGDPNVVIMIDGKPSGMLRGEGRGQALQQLQASQFDRVEVMTNPSAAFSPEGGAGVINLITKHNRGVGLTGSARANVGSDARYNGGVSTSYSVKKWTLSADAGWRHDKVAGSVSDHRESRDVNGTRNFASQQTTTFRSEGNSLNLRGEANYDASPNTRYGAELRYNQIDFKAPSSQAFASTDGAGDVVQSYSRIGSGTLVQKNIEGSLNYRRKLSGTNHELTFNANHEVTDRDTTRTTNSTGSMLGGIPPFEDFLISSRAKEDSGKLEYKKPLPGEAQLDVGAEYKIDRNTYINSVSLGDNAVGAQIVPTLQGKFFYRRWIYSGFATYQRPVGDLTVLAGLRVESRQQKLHTLASDSSYRGTSVDLYPSLHLNYKIDEQRQLSASYSRRVQRASPEDINPNLVYQDPNNYKQGNRYLRDSKTNSYEMAYQYAQGSKYYLATIFLRSSEGTFTDIVNDVGRGIFVTSKANLGRNIDGGIELVGSAPISRKLSYILSGSLFWNQIDPQGNVVAGSKKSGVSYLGSATLNWQATQKDFFQVSGSIVGRRLTPQGYREPTGLLNLGYRHKFSDKVTGVVSVQDALRTINDRFVIDTPALSARSATKINARAVFVGLTYGFGGPSRKPAAFDYESNAGLGPPSH